MGLRGSCVGGVFRMDVHSLASSSRPFIKLVGKNMLF